MLLRLRNKGALAMIFITLLMTAYAGFVLMALTMDRHETQFTRQPLPARWRLPARLAGYGLLLVSAAVGVKGWGWEYGLILWVGSIAISATVLAVILTYRPRWVLYSLAVTPFTLLALL
jgi:hypothetical protein